MLETVGLWTPRLTFCFLAVFTEEDFDFVAVLGVLLEMCCTFACALPNSTWFTCVANLREHNVSCTKDCEDGGSSNIRVQIDTLFFVMRPTQVRNTTFKKSTKHVPELTQLWAIH